MDDLVQNPEAQKLAQMLQQQQMQKFLQSMQGAGAMTEADRQNMAMQRDYSAMTPMNANVPQQGGMPIISPEADYGMPINQPNYSGNMPMGGAPVTRRGLLQGAMSELDRGNIEQSMGRGAATMVNPDMMRRR
jgi:hypothetical protein